MNLMVDREPNLPSYQATKGMCEGKKITLGYDSTMIKKKKIKEKKFTKRNKYPKHIKTFQTN